MKQRARPLNRLLSLLLALVMALSLLPTAVLADDEISSGTDTGAGWDGSGTVTTGWGGYDRHKWFARLTLVYFPGGLEKWCQTTAEGGGYTIYGQLDTSSDYTEAKMREVKLWYNTNAMDYLARGVHWPGQLGRTTKKETAGREVHWRSAQQRIHPMVRHLQRS